MTEFLIANFGQAKLLSAVDADDVIFYISAEDAAKLPDPGASEAFALTLWDGDQEQEIVYCTDNPGSGTLTVSRAEEDTTAKAWLAGTELRNAPTRDTITNLLQTGFVSGNKASQAEAEAGAVDNKLMTPLATTRHFGARTTSFSRSWLLSADVEAARSALGWETKTFSGTGLEDTFTLPSDDWDTPYTKIYVDEVFVQDTDWDITGDQLVFDSPPAAGVDNIVAVKGVNFAFSTSFPGANTVSTDAIADNAVTQAKMADASVGTAELIGNAVTYAKIQQVSDTDKVLGRSTAGAGNVEEIAFTPLARTLAALTSVATFQPAITTSGWPVPTAMVAFFFDTAAPAGWVDAHGGTIGNASSGASARANADAEALFTKLYNATTNTVLQLYTSAGSTVARDASAAIAWAANRRLALPDIRGIFIRGLDASRGIDSGRALGSEQIEMVGQHAHTATFSGNSLGNVTPTIPSKSLRYGANQNGGSISDFGWSSGDSATTASGTVNLNSLALGTPSGSVTVNNSSGTENRPRNIALRVCMKL